MIPAPITQLPTHFKFDLQRMRIELTNKGYETELQDMIISLVTMNMIKDLNMRQLIKYCAEKDMGMV